MSQDWEQHLPSGRSVEAARSAGAAERNRDDLIRLVLGSPCLVGLLEAARMVDAPNWCVGGGVLRDLVKAAELHVR